MNNYVMALFASGTTNFDYMGLGPLSDAISAIATETATSNGNITYTMEMSYPINGRLASQLVEGNLIKAQVSKTPGDFMIFEINETLKSDDRTITVYCDAYANRILRMSFDNGGKFGSFPNVQEALNAARAQMAGIQSDFTLSSGIGTRLDMSGVTSKNTMPTTYQDFNAYLDAIMDKVQGNVRFGVNSIQIVSDRGRDITDTVLRDDKNTNGISIKVDTSNIINRIIPILPVLDKDGNVTQETKVGKIVTSSVAFKFINFYAGQVVNLDTQDLANSYFNRTNCDRPTTTATVQTSMLDEDLTDIRLFDRIQVYSSKIGYQAKLKVCERDFDILAGAVSEFKLGSSSVTVFNSQTGVINAINSAVQSSQYAAITADGKNTAYYEGADPANPKENDLWFHNVDGINQIDQYVNGNWVTIVSDSTGEQIRQKVEQAAAEAHSAVATADQLASKYDDTNSLASQAMGKAVSAEGEASSAVATANSAASEFGRVDQKADSAVASALNAQSAASDAVSAANSTALEFGKVSQKTDSAVANSLNAQSAASDAIKQASSAAADSKDAKQIAGAVSQSYKTLTDGSTMTIAELESGLAVKLTKTDLDGYATQTWTQNQVKMTADGINGTMSSIKSTVDSQTTSINDLKADSSSFKSQFTTVNNTLGKQTTDIGTLQATSKELTSGFNTLTSDNTTNKNDISQLQQTATEVSSTLETVQTQVQNSAVGTNLLTGTSNEQEYTLSGSGWLLGSQSSNGTNVSIPCTPGASYTYSAIVKSTTYDCYLEIQFFDSGKNWIANSGPIIGKDTGMLKGIAVAPENAAFVGVHMVLYSPSGSQTVVFNSEKLEKGSLATDWCPNPADNASVTAFSQLSQTVDGMKADMSKKIEQKDLNGYATETWAQNQINATADGINATLSSIKSTVDGQTTSVNDLKADSSGFKVQFQTVNDTLGKQTTDIGSLQTTSKELTTGFNTLTTDNTTNKNDISQLKQTATEVSSTLETVQTQVKNSAVGTNLLYGTAEFNPWNGELRFVPNGYLGLTLAFEKDSDGDIAWHLSGTANGSGTVGSYNWQLHNAYPSTYAFSVSVKGTFANTTLSGFYVEGSTSTRTINWSSTYSRWVATGNVASGNGVAAILYFGIKSGDTVDIWVKKWKLEKGSLATDWCPNPADNATVTALSSLSQTVDGIKADISKKIEQKDLNGYATETWTQNQIKTTADGISGALSSVKNTVDGHDTSINELKADSSSFKTQFTTVSSTLDKQSTDIGTLQASSKSFSASFDSLNSDNDTNKHNISQLQASATEFNSTLMTVQQQVTDSAVGTNLLLKTGTPFSMTSTNTVNQSTRMYALSRRLEAGTTVTLSFDAVSTASANFLIQSEGNDGGSWMAYVANVTADTTKKHYTATITLNLYSQQGVYFRIDNVTSGTTITVSNMKLELGSNATDYSANPADNATVDAVSSISQTIEHIQTTVSSKVDNETYQSKINQLSDQINLRVESKGVINAVNVSKEGIQIYGDKLHITATTFIDDAIIKDAMIESLDATKIKVGTLDATKVNIVNLNATNITTGIINGSNLSINLNTGNVEFQEGRIHNSNNTIDININSGYMSVANGSNRVMLKNGEMQFVEPGTYDTSTNPYLKISNTFGGQSTEGAAFIGRKYAALTNSDNATGNGMFDVGLGTETFSGFATGYGSGLLNQGWHATKVGGADRGVIISGGKEATYRTYATASPSITVGASGGTAGSSRGTNIVLDCNYLYNYSTWVRTSSHAANVYVADDGAIVRASSASKYKTNIERSFETEMGERILEVPTAHWLDKAEVRNKALNPQAPDPRRYFGMIADDLDDAGLNELVEYNEKGEVEGIMYDRVALTLIPLIRNYRDRITELETKVKETKEA